MLYLTIPRRDSTNIKEQIERQERIGVRRRTRWTRVPDHPLTIVFILDQGHIQASVERWIDTLSIVFRKIIRDRPRTAGSLFETHNDLTLAKRWMDVRVMNLPANCGLTVTELGLPNIGLLHFRITPLHSRNQRRSRDGLCGHLLIIRDTVDRLFKQYLPRTAAFYLAIRAEDSSTVCLRPAWS
jgi:hypothetical protein